MKTVSVSELKAHLSAQLRHVKAGEDILVVERGRPVARLVPIGGEVDDADMARLVAEGLVRPGTGELDNSFWRATRPQDPGGAVRSSVGAEREASW